MPSPYAEHLSYIGCVLQLLTGLLQDHDWQSIRNTLLSAPDLIFRVDRYPC